MICIECSKEFEGKRKYCLDCLPNNQKWARENKDKNTSIQSRYQRKIRKKVLEFLGNRCMNPDCKWINDDGSSGCTDWRALQVDHVYGGGTREHKEISRNTMYLKILRGAEGYQLLCANCNWIKKYDNNEIPNIKSEAAGFAART